MINKKASLLCCLLMFLSTFVDAAPALERGIDNDGNPTRSSSTSLSILDLWNDSTANSFACTKYSVDGMCYWLKCSWYGCRVRTSMLVSHYNPDVTIEVIQTEKKLPLSPVSDFFHKIGKKVTETVISESSILGLGQGYRAGDGQRKGSGVPKQFHDAVAMGNPALPLYSNSVGMALGLVGWCQSDVMLYNPYFVSTASPEWRSGFLEGIYTLGNMLTLNNSIGGGFSGYAQWGTLYPRIGTAYHVDNSKSAGTIATRVANIITNKNMSLHLSQTLPATSGNNRIFNNLPGKKVEHNDKNTAYFQQNFPKNNDKKCRVFPQFPLTDHRSSKKIQSDTENYVWTLWRKYKCCSPKGQSFITKVEW